MEGTQGGLTDISTQLIFTALWRREIYSNGEWMGNGYTLTWEHIPMIRKI